VRSHQTRVSRIAIIGIGPGGGDVASRLRHLFRDQTGTRPDLVLVALVDMSDSLAKKAYLKTA
jgi:hypothetical protein